MSGEYGPSLTWDEFKGLVAQCDALSAEVEALKLALELEKDLNKPYIYAIDAAVQAERARAAKVCRNLEEEWRSLANARADTLDEIALHWRAQAMGASVCAGAILSGT
jgi:hypothetical protein